MKKTTIILIVLAFITISCRGRKAPEIDFGNRENPLFGKTYQNITDIPELNHWQLRGGSIIYAGKNEDGSFRFAIEEFNDENRNIILLFVELLPRDESGRSSRKILDSIDIKEYNEGVEFMSFACRVNGEHDSEIGAVVVWENKEILNNIVRAWRANTNTGRFEEIDVESVDCWNPRQSG